MMKSEYVDRRTRLAAAMEDNSALLLYAGKARKRSADSAYPFAVNRNFYYLTGIRQEETILLMIKSDSDVKTYLFILEPDELKEKWVGKRMSTLDAKQSSGISSILFTNSLLPKLDSVLNPNDYQYGEINTLYLDLDDELKIDDRKTTRELKSELEQMYKGLNIIDVMPLFINFRSIKSEYEVSLTKEAIKITEIGLQKILTILEPGLYEYNLVNAFEHEIKDNGGEVAFDTICASGKNGVILHYPEASDMLGRNDLVLLDLGASVGCYNADISRTYPVNGKFSTIQRKIYKIVLECNKAVINYVRPGLTLLELQEFTIDFLAAECVNKGLILKKEDIKNVYYHNVSHSLGLDVHDIFDRNRVLEPGMIITVEPGLYFKDLDIGVRVEDDVLVTPIGSECLSKDIIKEIEDIEKILATKE
ncbi:MAG: aminopeptidase P N-terminal domain-containing protein [Bacilli bacterium]|jgi:Xaa-Pro aminopeptidase